MALITAAEAKVYIPSLTGTTDDTTLDTLIARAGSLLASYCGYPVDDTGVHTLESATYTQYLPGPGGRRLQVPVYPLGTITSIEDDPTEAFDGTTYLVASGDYVSRTTEGIVLLKTTSTHGAWSRSSQEVIKIVTAAGYSTVPAALKGACGLLVAHWHQGRHTFGVASVTTAAGVTEAFREETIPRNVRQMIEPFRLHACYMAADPYADGSEDDGGRGGLIWR